MFVDTAYLLDRRRTGGPRIFVDTSRLLDGLEEAIEMYHAQLRQELARPDPRKITIARIAHALGRAYSLRGDTDAARPYLLQAAAAARENLEQQRQEGRSERHFQMGKPYDWANKVLACALKHWWAELPEATSYFQEAVAVFAEGQQEETEYAAERSHRGAMYGHIFLGNYAQARAAGQAYLRSAEASTIPHPDLYIPETVLIVIDDLEAGTFAAYQHARIALEVCFMREEHKLSWSSDLPRVDMYELVQRFIR
jgi:tetratricopeptide (TPR) repeat protein